MNIVIDNDIKEIICENLPWEIFEGKTILIAGANGFIPSYIVRTFIELSKKYSGIKVLALVRNEEKARAKFVDILNNENFKLIIQDISTPFTIDEHIDYIIHAASQASPKYYGVDPVGTLKANTLGTAYLLDLAIKNDVEKFLFISSGEVYGTVNEETSELKEDNTGNIDITNVRSCYGESKRMGETMCVSYAHQYGFKTNMVRLSHTYGPGIPLDDGRVFADFVSDVIHNRNIVLNSDGSAKRSFCYITDMIKAMFYVLFYGENMNAYNIASDSEISILELAKMLTGLYPEKNLKVEFNKNVFKDGYLKSPSSRLFFNTDKLKSLGWKETIDIKTGFKRMIESYSL